MTDNMYSSYKNGTEPELEYFYFNGRGRGEGVRILFAAAGLEFKEHRVELGGEEWAKMKPTTPYGCLPLLKVGQTSIGESIAIGSYVAKRGGLAGTTAEDQAIILALVLLANDFREGLATVMFMADKEAKPKAMETFLTGPAAKIMDQLTKAFKSNGTKFLYGRELTFADIWFYHCLELLLLGNGNKDFLDKWPELDALYKRVEESPKIAEYMKKRPETAF